MDETPGRIVVPVCCVALAVLLGPVPSGHAVRTAHTHNPLLGWAVITHPFHPLRGQRFEVLKTRKVAGIETLILRHPQKGSHAVALEWTDCAIPATCDLIDRPHNKLDAVLLLELAELILHLNESTRKGLDK